MPTRNGELPVDLEKAPIPAEQHLPPRTDLTRLTTALDELHGSVIAAIRARERLVGAPSDVVEEKCHLARESLTGLLIERLARDESRALLSTAYGREWMPHGPYWADRDGNSTREARSAVLRGSLGATTIRVFSGPFLSSLVSSLAFPKSALPLSTTASS
jgi:hypothetical protein